MLSLIGPNPKDIQCTIKEEKTVHLRGIFASEMT